ncbi:MAG TPA: PVC-type heme-binding CxxCH protein [Planctomycetaceae bacterium]|nr:PVC-type heme-binding CxxCH protein [Planctomycetaceae bacterium]
MRALEAPASLRWPLACALCATVLVTLCAAPLFAEDEHPPSQALAGLDVGPGLEATLFASEPMMLSPTNIDVDYRGRVWVCEVVNYRHRNGERPEGDRILILEDTDGDGKADKSTVFYQGRDIDSAMGICVLGNRVIVSCSPNILVFTDTDGDGKADKKEIFFSKTGIPQHDHTAHKFVFGPDGRLYWNFGNAGHSVHDRDGNLVKDIFGRPVVDKGQPYHDGMAFRCELDGSNFEVLAHNFRNNYELAVDSFGGLWQSDNDDDGNRAVRINYLLEYGNYGYRDEMTGASWQTPRTNLEATIPERHWHQNDPGVVPNLLVTGAGSPTGIVLYEGALLPKEFQEQVIHADAGPSVVRSYSIVPDGAGYRSTKTINLLSGARDHWFRPSDVCVAPDGSLMVADWYDPGVGGHRMGDVKRGRIFRLAPPKTPYRVPKYDFHSIPGAIEALASPNLATRYLAWTALHTRGAEAEPELARVFEKSPNPRLRARALWLLAMIDGRGNEYIARAAKDSNANIRVTALRAERRVRQSVVETIRTLVHDPSPVVRRECAIALRNVPEAERAPLWAELARAHDGHDRWCLEALGIGADGDWDGCLDAWLKNRGNDAVLTKRGRDLVWRSRSRKTPALLEAIVRSPETVAAEFPRLLRAFDFQHGPEKQQALVRLAFGKDRRASAQDEMIRGEALARLDRAEVLNHPEHMAALKAYLTSARGTTRFVDLLEHFKVPGYSTDLLAVAQANSQNSIGVRAIRLIFDLGEQSPIAAALNSHDPKTVEDTLAVLGSAEDSRAAKLLWPIVDDAKRPLDVRRQAIRGVGRTTRGASEVLSRAEQGHLEASLREAASAAVYASASESIRARAGKVFPLPPAVDARPLPPVRQLLRRRGDPRKGEIVFATVGTCAKCHVVNGQGKDVGPNLSEIGAKLSRPAIYESILFPSAAISHNFAAYTVVLSNGNAVSGILLSRTADSIAIKGADAITRAYRMAEVEEVKEQSVSLMPADLQKTMTADDLVNLVEYLTTLKPQAQKAVSARVNGLQRKHE